MNINKDFKLSNNKRDVQIFLNGLLDNIDVLKSFQKRSIKKVLSCKSNYELQAFLNKLNEVLGIWKKIGLTFNSQSLNFLKMIVRLF